MNNKAAFFDAIQKAQSIARELYDTTDDDRWDDIVSELLDVEDDARPAKDAE